MDAEWFAVVKEHRLAERLATHRLAEARTSMDEAGDGALSIREAGKPL